MTDFKLIINRLRAERGALFASATPQLRQYLSSVSAEQGHDERIKA